VVAVVGTGFGLIPVSTGDESNSASAARASARAWTAVLALVAGSFALNWLRDLLFPSGCFAIGHGAERYRTQDTVRWVVVVGLLVSAVGSALVSIAGA